MCGIVGVINGKSVIGPLIDGLRNLEYRGYDSAGIAILRRGEISRSRATGKLENLVHQLSITPIDGTVGIGHTRWATHGSPTLENAHPHVADGLAVVHNGIIENFTIIRAELEAKGVSFESETDSEVIPKLIGYLMRHGQTCVEAVSEALKRLEGQYAIVAMSDELPGRLIAARKDCPLAIAVNRNEVLIASDILAFGERAEEVAYLDDRDMAIVSRKSIYLIDECGERKDLRFEAAHRKRITIDKAGHRHFMHKEIHEQPLAVSNTLDGFRIGRGYRIDGLASSFVNARSLNLVACGTSYYAGTIGRCWLEEFANIPVNCDIASEYRYRMMPTRRSTANLFISQSGETADTLACLRRAATIDEATAAIVNVPTSTMAREAGVAIPTLAGPEIGVASTKAFTAQLTTLLVLARSLAEQRGQLSRARLEDIDRALDRLPQRLEEALSVEGAAQTVAEAISDSRSALFVGRGTSHGLALEGALKLKEISYIHAEGVAAGELKHGPLALVDRDMPVFVIAPPDAWQTKTASNLHEIGARQGRVILISDSTGIEAMGEYAWKTIEMPTCEPFTIPIVYAIALQLVAYHTAVLRGTDIDQPRNLAKSVTVE